MQNQQVDSINRDYIHHQTRSVSSYQLENTNKMIKYSAIGLFILALILSIVLAVGIALIFTIGPKLYKRSINTESSNLSVSSLYEPCTCGCPSIEPIFNNRTKASGRIINGETARTHSWPWQMLLLVIDRNQIPISFCGATLITDRHVLTAAHCVHQYVPPFIFLFPGQNTLNFSIPLTSGYMVQKVYIHEGYNVLLHDDIAILTLGQPLRFDSYVHPICLATPNSPILQAQEELIAIGWGRISAEPSTSNYAQNLQQVKLSYVPASDSDCSEIFRPVTNVHPGQMCAGKTGSNACQGDSGGPLMRRIRISNTENYYWQQIGIASKTIDCGWNSTRPDIYINIPYYYHWIMKTVKRAV
jgi:secreted trypsin-like serine protease